MAVGFEASFEDSAIVLHSSKNTESSSAIMSILH